jgi:lipopolysaccharide/colanic/teichoic acid biosynthesis glycosyltransferase
MLLVMWMAGCLLAALASVALSAADGPWLLGFAAILAAQGVVLAGRAARLPAWVTWPAGLGLVAAYAVRYGAEDLVAYVGLAAALMILIDRLAALSDGVSTVLLRDGRPTTPTDPIARDFARARREELPLSIALISVSGPRPSPRRLARVVRDVLPYLRVTDAVVRLTGGAVAVVLPGADARVAATVLSRALAAEPPGLLLGLASFPEDGQTFAVLKAVARSRQRPWPGDAGPRTREPRRSPAPQPVGVDERPAVLVETRALDLPLRRAVDLLVLAATAPLTVPLVGALALAVKLDSPGPAFVRIKRLGRDGRPFELLKLRSMARDADRMKEQLKHLNTMAWPDFKIADDPRVTRLGRVLRKTSLDELPQLYNVLRGQMTLIGPRPCSVALADYRLWQGERLEVSPGIVGRWQADGRGTMDFADRCRLDIRQVRTHSLRLELLLVLATIRSVFASKGAY